MGRKIYFKHGVMGSSKSLDLIRAEYNYRERGLGTIVFTPAVDTRNDGKIKSRIGLSLDAIVVSKIDNIFTIVKDELKNGRNIEVVFADEIHFLQPIQIDQLGEIADTLQIPVLGYGLRSDFQHRLFPASQRLFEIADEFEEIKAMCGCGRKAICNARFINGRPTKTGEQIMVGDQEYKAFCRGCYNNLFADNS
jgi:thymidine kinase